MHYEKTYDLPPPALSGSGSKGTSQLCSAPGDCSRSGIRRQCQIRQLVATRDAGIQTSSLKVRFVEGLWLLDGCHPAASHGGARDPGNCPCWPVQPDHQKDQLARPVQCRQAFGEQSPKQTGQDPHGQKEAPATGGPSGAIQEQPTARHDDMHMGPLMACGANHCRVTDGGSSLTPGYAARMSCRSGHRDAVGRRQLSGASLTIP